MKDKSPEPNRYKPKENTQPDIPPTVEEVRMISLHKSKGLSSSYVFIAHCVEGILPPESGNDRPGSLYITYAKQMTIADAYGANVAFQK